MSRAGDMERERMSGDHWMDGRLRRSSRRGGDVRARGKGRAHPGRPDPRSTDQIPPGCPSFVADPAFREIASRHTYGRHSTIVRQGDAVRYAYVLRRGLVQVSTVLPNGKSFADLMGPGSVFGVPWTLAGLPHGFAITAIAECDFDLAEAPRFLEYLKDHPVSALELLGHLCRQEIRLVENVLQLSARVPTGDRLMSALIELGRIYGVPAESGLRIPVPLYGSDAGRQDRVLAPVGLENPGRAGSSREVEAQPQLDHPDPRRRMIRAIVAPASRFQPLLLCLVSRICGYNPVKESGHMIAPLHMKSGFPQAGY